MNIAEGFHHRRSIRLSGYDYSQAGAYFITVCTQRRETLFGEIREGVMYLNYFGLIVQKTWNDLVNHVRGINLGVSVVMPNHIHGIIWIVEDDLVRVDSVGAGSEPAPTKGKQTALPEIVRQLKTFSAMRINTSRGTLGVRIWQRNYFEHIIRDEEDHARIVAYIESNPGNWEGDEDFRQ